MRTKYILLLLPFIILYSCNNTGKLPVYGNKTTATNASGTTDSVDFTLPPFSFVNQDSQTVTLQAMDGKIFVTEFFFTSCPSICPKMQAQMLRVYEKYKTNPNVAILAFTIDPGRDTVGKLKQYEKKLGIESPKWNMLTGNKDSIYTLAESFMVSAAEDPDAPGGHVHSGSFILIDKHKRLRGYYDGTKAESVAKLLEEMDILLKEE